MSQDNTSPEGLQKPLTGRDIVQTQEGVEEDEDSDEDREVRGHTSHHEEEPIPLQP